MTIFLITGILGLMIALASLSSDSVDDVTIPLTLGITMVVMSIIAGGLLESEYKQGFIDAKTGVDTYELRVNSDSTRTWQKIE